MGYDEELKKLQKIITSDTSTEEQRNVAREARNTLIDSSIKDAFASFDGRTAEYDTLINKLQDVVNRIKANQLTTAMADFNAVIKKIKTIV